MSIVYLLHSDRHRRNLRHSLRSIPECFEILAQPHRLILASVQTNPIPLPDLLDNLGGVDTVECSPSPDRRNEGELQADWSLDKFAQCGQTVGYASERMLIR